MRAGPMQAGGAVGTHRKACRGDVVGGAPAAQQGSLLRSVRGGALLEQ
jgi:hypothetical protein